MHKLSVIIITKNEIQNIRACLESVSWADEVIVVDSGSEDGTPDVCRALGARVYVHDWPGFGIQKNRALAYAQHDWVLSLDADERVTAEVRTEIESAINADKDGYYLPRLSQFCGRFIHHCGWYPDYVLRLFKRTKARFTEDIVHEQVLLQGLSGFLKAPLLHYTYLDATDVERKTVQYATAGAQQSYLRGKRAHIWDAPLRGAWAFIRTLLLRAGFLDGIAGYRIACMNGRTTYLKYRILRSLAQND